MGSVIKDGFSLEDILLQALKQNLIYERTVQIFGVICITCDDNEDRSHTVKLNRAIQYSELNQAENSTGDEKGLSSFRRRSHSADSRVNKRISGFKPYIRQRPCSANNLTNQNATYQCSTLEQNGDQRVTATNLQSKQTEYDSHINVTKEKKKSSKEVKKQCTNILDTCEKYNESDKTFRADITDAAQRQLLERTLKEFIKVKYQQSICGDKAGSHQSPDATSQLKVSPVAKDFFKMLSLQARIMGVSVPSGFISASEKKWNSVANKDYKSNKPSLMDNNVEVSCLQSTLNSENSPSKLGTGDHLGITKNKRLSFSSAQSKCGLEQGKFAKVMHQKLEQVKLTSSPQNSPEKKRSISVNIPPVIEKKHKKDDKRKQVLKKQHALRIYKDRCLSHSSDDLLNTTLPFEVKEEDDMDTCFETPTNSSVGNFIKEEQDFQIKTEDEELTSKVSIGAIPNTFVSSLHGSSREELSVDKTVLSTPNGSTSIMLPPSAYVFKPIVISPSNESSEVRSCSLVQSTEISKTNCSLSSKTLQKPTTDDTVHSCVSDIVSEHSFVPRESLSSLQEDYDHHQCEEENSQSHTDLTEHSFIPHESLHVLKECLEGDTDKTNGIDNGNEFLLSQLPFSDIDNIPDVINEENNPLSATISDVTGVEKEDLPNEASEHFNEDSNTSFCSTTSYGFEVLNEDILSPDKSRSQCTLDTISEVVESDHEKSNMIKDTDRQSVNSNELLNASNITVLQTESANTESHDESNSFETLISKQPSKINCQNNSKCPAIQNKVQLNEKRPSDKYQHKLISHSLIKDDEPIKEKVSIHKNVQLTSCPHSFDHNYATVRHSKKANYQSGTESSAKKCRKAIQTKKYFPLKAYLMQDTCENSLQTEVVHMDSTNIIGDETINNLSSSKKRCPSSENLSVTPAKRIKSELNTPKTSLNKKKKTVNKIVSNKLLHSELNKVKGKENKNVCAVDSKNVHRMKSFIDKKELKEVYVNNFPDKMPSQNSSDVNSSGKLNKCIDQCKKMERINYSPSQSKSCKTVSNELCVEDSTFLFNMKRGKYISSKTKDIVDECLSSTNNEHYKCSENNKVKHSDRREDITKQCHKTNWLEDYLTGSSNYVENTVNSTNIQTVNESEPKIHGNRTNKDQKHFTRCKNNPAFSSPKNEESPFHESIIVSLPIEQIFNCKKLEIMKQFKTDGIDIRSTKDIKSNAKNSNRANSENSEIISKRRNSTGDMTIDRNLANSNSCHLLVRPIPTVHSGVHVARSKVSCSKAAINKDNDQLSLVSNVHLRQNKLEASEPVNLSTDAGTRPSVFHSDCSKRNVSELKLFNDCSIDKMSSLISSDIFPSKSAEDNQGKVKNKRKRKNSRRKRKSFPVSKAELNYVESQTGTSESHFQKESLKQNLSLGKGRLGRRRSEVTGEGGFKMKKRWLEMWGPGSPGSPTYQMKSPPQNISSPELT